AVGRNLVADPLRRLDAVQLLSILELERLVIDDRRGHYKLLARRGGGFVGGVFFFGVPLLAGPAVGALYPLRTAGRASSGTLFQYSASGLLPSTLERSSPSG